MFYSICVFVFGIYVGQEFNNLPSIKETAYNTYNTYRQPIKEREQFSWIPWIQFKKIWEGHDNKSK